uniref:Uncharacterized protein n=1 Tax=Rhizophora mucronata TaxID=61149 RepID=A0A2P2QDN3_RHIMU
MCTTLHLWSSLVTFFNC